MLNFEQLIGYTVTKKSFFVLITSDVNSEQQIDGRMIFPQLKVLKLIHLLLPIVRVRLSLIQLISSVIRQKGESDNLENLFIDLLLPKTKAISVGIFLQASKSDAIFRANGYRI